MRGACELIDPIDGVGAIDQEPLISIITVCYNSAATIADTLASVAAQSWPRIEHIVIDGGSLDGTLDVIAKHRGQLTQLLSEPDGGIYDAMNKGLALARGDIVGFLNADDVYADDEVLALVATKLQCEALDAVYGDVEFFAGDDPRTVVRRYSSARFSPNRIAWGWMPAHPTLYLRRCVYQKFGLFRTDYRIAGDYEYVVRIFKDASLRSAYLPRVLVRMRIGGVSTNGLHNTIALNREVLRACRENGISTNLLMILSKYPAKFMDCLRT